MTQSRDLQAACSALDLDISLKWEVCTMIQPATTSRDFGCCLEIHGSISWHRFTVKDTIGSMQRYNETFMYANGIPQHQWLRFDVDLLYGPERPRRMTA